MKREIDLTHDGHGGVHVSLWSEDWAFDDDGNLLGTRVVDDETLTMTRVEAVAVARKILALYGEVQ